MSQGAVTARAFPASAFGVMAIILAVTLIAAIAATSVFSAEQMYIILPLLASTAVFATFVTVLWVRIGGNLFGEIGFIYLGLALAYTILPGIVFLVSDFSFPLIVEGLNFIDLSPEPAELGAHLWRHLLFIAGVAVGYLVARGTTSPSVTSAQNSTANNGQVIAIWIAMITGCILTVSALSSPVTTYLEHYTRFDGLSVPLRRLAYLCLIFKGGGYFVLLALLFSQYRKYRIVIFIAIPIICIYEGIYSFGSRIEILTILLAFVGFYNHKVSAISINKGISYLLALAILFSGIELFRSSGYSVSDAQVAATKEGGQQVVEFGAVFNTSFHLYAERAQGALPERQWPMFFYEFIGIIPFLDHTTYNPQYWYARAYFPQAVVPPATMGVIADSAIWGGEFDLLVRSIVNGALFALLTRWFIKRRDKWLALTIYIYCYATCVLTLKYSVLYQLIPLTQILLPTLLFTELLFRLQKAPMLVKPTSSQLVE